MKSKKKKNNNNTIVAELFSNSMKKRERDNMTARIPGLIQGLQ
jgi:hypothetical protein